jgi:hypothetical protein
MTLRNWLCFLTLPALAAAQPLSSLVDEALHNNREVLAAQKKYEAARQRPSQAGSLPPPTVSLGYSSNGAPYPVDGIGRDATSNAGVMISQDMPFPGKQRLRAEIAARQADAEFQDYLTVRLNVVTPLRESPPPRGRRNCCKGSCGYPKRVTPPAARPSRISSKRRRSSLFSRHSCCATSRSSAAGKSKSPRCSTGP